MIPLLAQLLRSSLVVAGLLSLGVGVGNIVAGQAKLVEYRALLDATPTVAPPDPAALFPTATEQQQRRELAAAKLEFYRLLDTAGRLLAALGGVLLVIGVVRMRGRLVRPGSAVAR